jgi:hypothetical protein
MAFGTQSAIFRQYLTDALAPTASFLPHLNTGGTWKAALYGNTGTPDNNATAVLSSYNGAASAWVVANELTSGAQWPAGGIALTWGSATRWNVSTANLVFFDADDTPGGGTVSLTAVWGDLVYDDALVTPVAKQGLAYHSYGSAQTVTSGTFTVVWSALGVVRWTQAPA